jgi:hypothetical protein
VACNHASNTSLVRSADCAFFNLHVDFHAIANRRARSTDVRPKPPTMSPEPMSSAYAKPVPTVLIAWFLSLGIDLFLHGGLLARLYLIKSPFILPADEAFRRIPLGYLAFLLLTAALFWLCRRLDVRGIRAGWRHGFVFGVVLWGSLVVGLYSISTATVPMLAAWSVGQAVELGVSGGIIGGVAAGIPLRRMFFWVTLIVGALLVLTIALQSLGVAPPMRLATMQPGSV